MKFNEYFFLTSEDPALSLRTIKDYSSVEEVTQKSIRYYYKALEAFRGIAALATIFYYSYQYAGPAQASLFKGSWLKAILPNLENSVSLFFVLSGFVNFLPFAQATLHQQGPFRAWNFLVRRALRIVPPYSIMLLSSIWILRYTGSLDPWPDLFNHITSNLTSNSANLLLTIKALWWSFQTLDTSHLFWIIWPMWLLLIEFGFYLMVAFLGSLTYHICHHLYGIKSRRTTLFALLILLFISNMACKIWVATGAHVPFTTATVDFFFLNRLDNFSLGMFLAVIVAAFARSLSAHRYLVWSLRMIAFALIGGGLYFAPQHDVNSLHYFIDQFLWGLAMMLLIASTVLSRRQSFWRRCLEIGPFHYLGKISYGLFLWNGLLLFGLSGYLVYTSDLSFLLSTFFLVVLAICLSSVSYWLIECPLSYLRYLFA